MSDTGIKVCTGTGATGIHVEPILPKCLVPVLMYRTYRSGMDVRSDLTEVVRYPYCRTELTEVIWMSYRSYRSCPVPGLMYRTCRTVQYRHYRRYVFPYVPYRTHPFLHVVQKVPFGLSTDEKSENLKTYSLLEFK